jgi:hypothetical protein
VNANPVAEVHIGHGLGLVEVATAGFNQAPGKFGALVRLKRQRAHYCGALAGIDKHGTRSEDKNVRHPGVVDKFG